MTDAEVGREFRRMVRENFKPVLNEYEAAEHIGVSVTWLRNNRRAAFAPPFVKYGTKTIRYRRETLDDWVRAQEVRN